MVRKVLTMYNYTVDIKVTYDRDFSGLGIVLLNIDVTHGAMVDDFISILSNEELAVCSLAS